MPAREAFFRTRFQAAAADSPGVRARPAARAGRAIPVSDDLAKKAPWAYRCRHSTVAPTVGLRIKDRLAVARQAVPVGLGSLFQIDHLGGAADKARPCL